MKTCVVQIRGTGEVLLRKPREGEPHLPMTENSVGGSGFIINEQGYVGTNAHVIRELEKHLRSKYKNVTLRVSFAMPEYHDNFGMSAQADFVSSEFSIAMIDDRLDIAILKTVMNPFKGEVRSRIWLNDKEVPLVVSTCSLYKEMPAETSRIAISGYPLQFPVLITTQGVISSAGFYLQNISGNEPFFVDAKVNQGNSGGPVYLQSSGEVIGIATAYRKAPGETKDLEGKTITTFIQNSGLSYVTPIKAVIDILDKNKIPWK